MLIAPVGTVFCCCHYIYIIMIILLILPCFRKTRCRQHRYVYKHHQLNRRGENGKFSSLQQTPHTHSHPRPPTVSGRVSKKSQSSLHVYDGCWAFSVASAFINNNLSSRRPAGDRANKLLQRKQSYLLTFRERSMNYAPMSGEPLA